MTTKRTKLTAEQFREHAERMRRRGATRVQAVDGDVTFEVEYGSQESPPEKQPAIGFMLDAGPELDEW